MRLVVDKVTLGQTSLRTFGCSRHQCFTFFPLYMLLLTEGRTGDAWEPSKNHWCFWNREAPGTIVFWQANKVYGSNRCCLSQVSALHWGQHLLSVRWHSMQRASSIFQPLRSILIGLVHNPVRYNAPEDSLLATCTVVSCTVYSHLLAASTTCQIMIYSSRCAEHSDTLFLTLIRVAKCDRPASALQPALLCTSSTRINIQTLHDRGSAARLFRPTRIRAELRGLHPQKWRQHCKQCLPITPDAVQYLKAGHT
jgi:hypothetical protein